ncbi:MAG: penicillin-binding transpeptidase domain-containing protein [Kofleriaceae bacterium]
MRRSHILLAGAVAIAGAAALFGNRGGTAAEVQGAPLEPGTHPEPAAGSPTAVKRTQATLAELLDLDKLTITATGDHYEAKLKDGRHAVLTLDPMLQAYAEKLLAEARAPRGAIVAMAPDGRILALAGRRSEPADKAEPVANGDKTKGDKPAKGDKQVGREGVFDWRLATEVWAPAASVFKLVTASALVAAGVDPTGKVCFHGGLRSVLESNLRDDKNDSRCESLMYGVAHSNNAILGKLAFQKLEPGALTKFARELGISANLPGAELTGVAGAVDIPAVRDLNFAQSAAGFSGSQLSAVGGALLAATFADDGEQPVPTLIASIDGVAQALPPKRRAVTAEVAKAVGKMMEATCEIGSAAKSFGRHQAIRVAGKTGTLTRTAPFYMEHSWFVGYAPAEQPQIIVSVVLGNPENWHLRGHEAARRLIDRAIDRTKPREKDRAVKITSTRRVGW